MRTRFVLPFLSLLLSGCAFLCAECGYLPYSQDYDPPQILPAPGDYPSVETAWTREAPFGINGNLKATFESPTYLASVLSWTAEQSRLGTSELDAFLQQRWQERFDGGNRMAFKLAVSLDPRFYTRKQFNLDDWHFSLSDEQGHVLDPLEVTSPAVTADEDSLAGTFYVYFPRFDAAGRLNFESPRFLRLQVDAPLTKLGFSWRFRPLTGPQ